MDVMDIVPLLGKSERDEAVQSLLKRFGVDQPLPRPKRDESQVNVELEGTALELAFFDAESMFPGDSRYLEGELILQTLFIHTAAAQGKFRLPKGLEVPADRKKAREVYGAPEWSSPVMKNDRWKVDNTKVLLCFTPDEKGVKQVAISYAGA